MFKCSKCDETFKTRGLQKRHLKEVHRSENEQEPQNKTEDQPELFRCNNCDFRCKSWIQMEKPIKVTHEVQPQKPFKQNLCDFKAKYKLQMEKHGTVRHCEEPQGKICYFCQQGFCRKADGCNFSHPAQPITMSVFVGLIASLVIHRAPSADIKQPVKMNFANLSTLIRMPSLS